MGRLTCLKPRVQAAPDRVKAHTISETTRDRGTWGTRRAAILRRDHGLCCVCRGLGFVGLAQEVDHIRPLWAGGQEDDGNLQAICTNHHKAKTAHEAAQRASGMGWEPWEPRR